MLDVTFLESVFYIRRLRLNHILVILRLILSHPTPHPRPSYANLILVSLSHPPLHPQP